MVDDLHLEQAPAARASTPNHARKVSATGWRRRARTGPGGERSAGIRAWARQRGTQGERARRLPATIIQEYEASP
ncbi:MAG TPA: hypothetical protein VGJ54_08625 [Streptosporangiaceae bacterium]